MVEATGFGSRSRVVALHSRSKPCRPRRKSGCRGIGSRPELRSDPARRVAARGGSDAATQRHDGVPEPVTLEAAQAERAQAARDGTTTSETSEEDVAAAFEAESSEMDAAVEERVHMIEGLPQLQAELDSAEDRLVILEVMAEGVCETGLFEPDDGWTPDREEKERAKLAVCESIRHQFVRLSSDSPNVVFLETMQEDDGSSELCKHLGVKAFPTVCFFKSGQLVWKTDGSARMTGDMSEGLLYFAEGPRLKSSEHVAELYSEDAYDAFMRHESAADVKIVMFTTPMCSPCIHVYPSYVTLAMNFTGIMDFARVEMDDSDAGQAALFKKVRVLEVPTFVLYHKGQEVSRDVSSHRGDLIGHVLQTAMKLGIKPPSPKKV